MNDIKDMFVSIIISNRVSSLSFLDIKRLPIHKITRIIKEVSWLNRMNLSIQISQINKFPLFNFTFCLTFKYFIFMPKNKFFLLWKTFYRYFMTYHFEKINPFYGCIESKYVSRKTCISCQLKPGFSLSKCKNNRIRLMRCQIEIWTKETMKMQIDQLSLLF